ncbi:MAG: hypothetical protein ABIC82_02025 [bacterium]
MTTDKTVVELFLPEGILEWFDIKSWEKNEDDISIVLEEKNNPPLVEKNENKKIISKGFKDITITDFPIRGRRSLLTFKRRCWQIEGKKEYLKMETQKNSSLQGVAICYSNRLANGTSNKMKGQKYCLKNILI